MTAKKGKKSCECGQYVMVLFMMFAGGTCGIYIAKYIDHILKREKTMAEIFFSMFVLFAVVYMAFFIQIILHEVGHLLFGRITGYQFSSLRIGRFMWIKENGAIRFRKLTLDGAGGQCLMIPPELENGKMPYVLYNMGGSIFNLLSAILFTGIHLVTKSNAMVTTLLMIPTVIGVSYALVNGIPMRLKMVNNDGYNAISLGRDPTALRAFWIQLKSNELSVKGMRIKDMPEEWFEMPSPEAMENSITASLGMFVCNRMMERMEFERAQHVIRELLQMNIGMIGLYRGLMTTDLVFCELVGENKNIEKILNEQQKKFMELMKDFPSVLRTKYAYALLFEKDYEKAETIKKEFEKIVKNFPKSGIVASERELMVYVRNFSLTKTKGE